MLKVGDRVPDVTAPLHDGRELSTRALRGRPWVVYFYPRDFTPVCTKEACGFRDRHEEIRAAGAEVYGASLERPERHAAFAASLGLDFPLVADVDRKLASAFGVQRLWGLLPFAKRVTFVVDAEGVVRRVVVSETDAGKHVDGAIAALRELSGAASP